MQVPDAREWRRLDRIPEEQLTDAIVGANPEGLTVSELQVVRQLVIAAHERLPRRQRWGPRRTAGRGPRRRVGRGRRWGGR